VMSVQYVSGLLELRCSSDSHTTWSGFVMLNLTLGKFLLLWPVAVHIFSQLSFRVTVSSILASRVFDVVVSCDMQ
jgi:hypothetical protein